MGFPSARIIKRPTFEIPYGSIERPTTRNTPAEQAKFEVPALQWGDISDAKHGFSLLNDCKYGYDAKGNVLRLSLLRSPEWPDPHADEGLHEFTYSMYAHPGTWREAETVRRGYELNYDLLAMETAKHPGAMKDEYSFLEVQAENVVMTAIKKAEDDGSLILRFYEWAGKESDVKIVLPVAHNLLPNRLDGKADRGPCFPERCCNGSHETLRNQDNSGSLRRRAGIARELSRAYCGARSRESKRSPSCWAVNSLPSRLATILPCRSRITVWRAWVMRPSSCQKFIPNS